jgi:TolB-like protein
MTDFPPAVFLSYASQDTAAAKRLCEALRAAGIEVWFDQSELVGGDVWDQKIRGQIAQCALFVPLISANTQARLEGYFRREWKQAAARTHDMAEEKIFLLPVVLDDTHDADAKVPAEFKGVQWTRLPGGEATPAFVARVQRLLGIAPPPSVGRVVRTPPSTAQAAPTVAPSVTDPTLEKPATAQSRWPLALAGVAALAVMGAVLFFALKPTSAPVAARAAEPKSTAQAATSLAPSSAAAANDKSLAVLPFANMSDERDSAFFADGVHEDLLTALAKVRDLKVISRTSVLGYRDASKRNLRQIAAELGVAHVLEGSVRRAGNKARITVQLIDARTDQHLWAESYDRDVTDIFAVQGEVAREITTALKATLTPGEQRLIGRQLTADPQAYELYVRARAAQQEIGEGGTMAEYERVIALFEQAIARDPSFVLAYVQLAQIHSTLYWFGTMDPTPARAAKMKAAVDAAVRLAPDLPEVRMVRGAYVYRVDLDWNAALAEFRAAELGLPNDAQLKFWLAVSNRRLGRWLESLDYFVQSVSVNPRDLSAVENWLGYLVTLRRYSTALEAIARVRVGFPNRMVPSDGGAAARFGLDSDRDAYARALAALPPAATEEARVSLALRVALARGDLAAADRLLAEARVAEVTEENNRVISDPVAFHRAVVAAARGDQAAARDFALEAERYYRTRSWTPRQQPWARLRLALVLALAGRADEAVREGREAFAFAEKQDAFAGVILRDQLGAVLLLSGRRDEAFAVLRDVMELPLGDSAALYRIDPLWASAVADPQFEAILRLQKSQ